MVWKDFIELSAYYFFARKIQFYNASKIRRKHRRNGYTLIFDFAVFALTVYRDYDFSDYFSRFIFVRS